QDPRVLEFARQIQVVRAALADHDADTFAVHRVALAQGRAVAHHVGALDQDIGVGEGDARAAHRVDGEKADVGLLVGHGVDRLAGAVPDHQFQLDAQPFGEGARQVDRYAGGLAAGRVAPG